MKMLGEQDYLITKYDGDSPHPWRKGGPDPIRDGVDESTHGIEVKLIDDEIFNNPDIITKVTGLNDESRRIKYQEMLEQVNLHPDEAVLVKTIKVQTTLDKHNKPISYLSRELSMGLLVSDAGEDSTMLGERIKLTDGAYYSFDWSSYETIEHNAPLCLSIGDVDGMFTICEDAYTTGEACLEIMVGYDAILEWFFQQGTNTKVAYLKMADKQEIPPFGEDPDTIDHPASD